MRRARGIAAVALGVLLVPAAAASARVGSPSMDPNCTWDASKPGAVLFAQYPAPTMDPNCIWDAPGHMTCKAPAASYGAIAYGRTSGAWGSSYHWGSQAEAESKAMQTCAKQGNDCEVVVWFDRKCGAVAAAEGAVAFWGLGDSDGQARADAQNKCEQGGGKDCRVQASECSN